MMLEAIPMQDNSAKPESSFPTAWGDEYDSLANDGEVCPIPVDKMASYMAACHYNYGLDEAPAAFSSFELLDTFHFTNRSFWIWSCKDTFDREWNIIVGQGASPFFKEIRDRVWMEGERYVSRKLPMEILLWNYPEYKTASWKVH
jgi:hypothetical protein